MIKNNITLGNLIKNVDSYSDNYDLYMLKDANFKSNKLCTLITNEENLIIHNQKLKYIFGIYTLKDVIENLKQQNLNYNIEDIVQAIQFYYTNDSFIELK